MERRRFLLASSMVGTIPMDAGARLASSGAGQSATWERLDGAKGDGIADDTRAIQQALDRGHGRVRIPAGTYLVSALRIPSNAELYGDGPTATIFVHKDGARGPVLQNVAAARDIRLSRFSIVGRA